MSRQSPGQANHTSHASKVVGARTHNLKNVSLEVSAGQLLGLTGVSGSGKSSLAIDTLHAEGQRRFVESFSPYARQFLERLDRPDADSLEPVAAGIAVDRKAPIKSSRSTVATMAELEPYLAALFAREAVPECPTCHVLAEFTEIPAMAASIAHEPEAQAIVSYPLAASASAESYLEVRDGLARDGVLRLLINDEVKRLEDIKPSEAVQAQLSVVLDRLQTSAQSRITEALERGFRKSDVVHLRREGEGVRPLSRGLSCPSCAKSFAPPRPGLFSYNAASGACPSCRGFGRTIGIDYQKVIPDEGLSLAGGALKAWQGKGSTHERAALDKLCLKHGVSKNTPWRELPASFRTIVMEGEPKGRGRFHGVKEWFAWLEARTYKMHVRVFLSRYRSYDPCEACEGTRLNSESRSYQVARRSLPGWHRLTVSEALKTVETLTCRDAGGLRALEVLRLRLSVLAKVGLGHLELDRPARTLSGGEAQRVGLTTALGTSLVGALIVVDEPTLGLHQSDIPPVIEALSDLARAGNAVIVIEHDPLVLRACDRVVALGPAAGAAGGNIIFDGDPRALPLGLAHKKTVAPARPLHGFDNQSLTLVGARGHNLRKVNFSLPIGKLTALTGVSGSGKSSLALGTLVPAIQRLLGQSTDDPPLPFDKLEGSQVIRAVHHVDQSPLGRTSRGNAATYCKAWEHVRKLFAKDGKKPDGSQLPAAHFSFNTEGGRCEDCRGEGSETVEMQFLADVAVVCPSCQGARFSPSTLSVSVAGCNVAQLLAMSVDEAIAWAQNSHAAAVSGPRAQIARSLRPLAAVGLGYLPIGQPLSTLSGGEAQRLKLARALTEVSESKGTSKSDLVVIDEPSAGLSASDVGQVIDTLVALRDRGATVLVVEHDPLFIDAADHVVDLGPGSGEHGGSIVFEGTPLALRSVDTKTGRALSSAFTEASLTPPKAGAAQASQLPEHLKVFYAREHNLKNISVDLPLGKLVVVTGPSGSGKSSLAFDVIFAEGQRRFLETLSPYARQFLPNLPRADVDAVLHVPPSIALDQRTTRGGATSTVATVTELSHYLRLLFAKLGTPHCTKCDIAISAQDKGEVIDRICRLAAKSPMKVYAPVVKAKKGTHLDVMTLATQSGFTMGRIDGVVMPLDPPPKLLKSKEHTVELVVFERLAGKKSLPARERLLEAMERSNGELLVDEETDSHVRETHHFSTARSCPKCGRGVPELDPRFFSFNTKQGQCPKCLGEGSLESESEDERTPCPTCHGGRLAALPSRVRLGELSYGEMTCQSVSAFAALLPKLEKNLLASERGRLLGKAALAELSRRAQLLTRVGLGYLSLDRGARTLSGGELQRLRLAAQLGAGLTGALYVLDEPTVGLHPRDTERLIENLRALVDTGSTVLVVEHDEAVIGAADHLIDLGPAGGRRGGHVMAAGSPSEVLSNDQSPTGAAFRLGSLPPFHEARPPASSFLHLTDCHAHNLKHVDLRVPMGRLTAVVGVSGSGKSTLVGEIFLPALRKKLGLASPAPLPFGKLELPKVGAPVRALAVDQAPIGRTSRSVPATFLGIFDHLRKVFAATKEAGARGYAANRFSFNSKEGRCPTCEGTGVHVAEMSFLPDVVSPCENCLGLRYAPDTLEVTYRGLNVGQTLQCTAREAADLFAAHPKVRAPLEVLDQLGVGYLALGQGSHTLSGGEAQRLKLATELTPGMRHEPTVYVLDEPTTGLHLSDVHKLLGVLQKLVDRGDTLVVVEHHPTVIAAADHVVELGPEGGEAGGRIVAEGTPRDVSRGKTATGKVLAELFARASIR